MFRQTASRPTFTQTPPEPRAMLLGAGSGADEDGAAAPWGEVAPAAGVGPLRVIPPPLPLPVPAPLPPPLPPPVPAPRPWPPPAAARLGGLASEDPARPPDPGWVSCLLSDPCPRSPGPPSPAARPCDAPELGIAPAGVTGDVPEADDWVPVRGAGRTRIETVDRSRNAIAPPESTMTCTVLPAGCRRNTAPTRPMAVLIRSASSANTSCTAGSRGQ